MKSHHLGDATLAELLVGRGSHSWQQLATFDVPLGPASCAKPACCFSIPLCIPSCSNLGA